MLLFIFECISTLPLFLFVCYWLFNPFPNRSSKLKHFADDNFKFDEMQKVLQKGLWEKGEIAYYEQFLLFPLCFQKICTADS